MMIKPIPFFGVNYPVKDKISFRLMTMWKFILLILFLFPGGLLAQTSNYWSRNFNEESSLLSGAVVGGGAGASAIFYNPASISEIEESKLSFNASLFSFEFLKAKNAYGDGIDFTDSRAYVTPRFLSYMIKLKKLPNWSLEFVFLSNANFQTSNVTYVDMDIDILKNTPGVERYSAFSNYVNRARDDYFGVGGSRKLGENWSVGLSMFVSAKTNYYSYFVDIEAGPIQNISTYDDALSYFTARYTEQEMQKFNDYRLLWKVGVLYKTDNLGFGINITTPSLGGIYSDGKRLMRKRSQSNITNEQTGEPIPNYLITDYKEKKDVEVNDKSPFSIAAGVTYHSPDKTKSLYTTVEYFAKIEPYRVAQADESNFLARGTILEGLSRDEWLSFVDGARSVFNVGIGYRWIVKKDLMILSGFRTDFNSKKDLNYNPFASQKAIKEFNVDKYHFTGGLTARFFGHDLMTGFQYTIGINKDQRQFINLSDPVEFNNEEFRALQGTREYSMRSILNALSLYVGATINFSQNKKNK